MTVATTKFVFTSAKFDQYICDKIIAELKEAAGYSISSNEIMEMLNFGWEFKGNYILNEETKTKLKNIMDHWNEFYKKECKRFEANFNFIELKLKHLIEEFNIVNDKNFSYNDELKDKLFEIWKLYVNNRTDIENSTAGACEWFKLLASKLSDFYIYNNQDSIEHTLNREWIKANRLFTYYT